MFNIGENIFPIVWEVTEAMELFDIQVVSLTSDGAKPNRWFYRLCQTEVKKDLVPYKTTNPFRANAQIYFFCDAPHLLKTTRNCFSNSFSHSKSRCLMVISLLLNNHSSTAAILCILWCILMQKGGENISWKWIESLYLSENTTTTPGVRMCHKLTRDHVWLTPYTRMRVYLAAQVKAI